MNPGRNEIYPAKRSILFFHIECRGFMKEDPRFWGKNWRENCFYVYLINFRYFRDNYSETISINLCTKLYNCSKLCHWTKFERIIGSKDYFHFIHFQPLWNFAGIHCDIHFQQWIRGDESLGGVYLFNDSIQFSLKFLQYRRVLNFSSQMYTKLRTTIIRVIKNSCSPSPVFTRRI